jgi:putative ABC transport system substrate-binding protein
MLFTTTAIAGPTKIAIANFGEHPVLNDVISGIKKGLETAGYTEGSHVEFVESHTNFDATLVPQMISKLRADKPDLMISITTPVSQTAKKALQGTGIPLVFSTVTDPVAAKLTPSWDSGDTNVTGVSDLQDMEAVFAFIRKLLPEAKNVGFPYNPGEDNDVALLEKAKTLAPKSGFTVVAVGVDNPNDIPVRIQFLRKKVDVIYVSGSNLLQSAAPAIASTTQQMDVPTISVNLDHVEKGFFLAAFAVDYHKVGVKTGEVAAQILKGKKPVEMPPYRLSYEEHVPMINMQLLKKLNIPLPDALKACDCFVGQ